MTPVGRIALLVIFVACSPRFPTEQPASRNRSRSDEAPVSFAQERVPALVRARRQLRAIGSARATNCGIDRDAATEGTVYHCGAAAIARGQPFFCTYEPPRNSNTPDASVGSDFVFVGYAFSPRQILFAVAVAHEKVIATPVWSKKDGALQPVRLGFNRALRPRLISGLKGHGGGAILTLHAIVSTVLLVDQRGKVTDVHVATRELSAEVVSQIRGGLRNAACTPPMLFGVPVSAEFSVVFTVSDGRLVQRWPPQPNSA